MLAKLPAAGSKSFVHERGQATHPSVHSFVLCVVFFTKKKKMFKRKESKAGRTRCTRKLFRSGTDSQTRRDKVRN